MALKTAQSQGKAPIIASTSEYGLFVGPEGAFGKAGIQCKAQKWSYLFKNDPDNTPMLMNVIDYLEKESDDFVAVEKGVDEFIAAWIERIERKNKPA